MGSEGAVSILFAKELRGGKGGERRRELVEEYSRRFANPYLAAQRGYIDEVIEARLTRPKVIQAFRFLQNKHAPRIDKKHGNIPL